MRYWIIDKAKGTAKLAKLGEVLATTKLDGSDFAWCIENYARCDTDNFVVLPEYSVDPKE